MDMACIEGSKEILVEVYAHQLLNSEYDFTGSEIKLSASRVLVYERGEFVTK